MSKIAQPVNKQAKPTSVKPFFDLKTNTTNVIGYFSPNPWPVHVSVSSLGRTIILQQAGDYILDDHGKKINDPVFEAYVGNNCLARELSPTPVPIIKVVPFNQQQSDGLAVKEARSFIKDSRTGATKPVLKPMAAIVTAKDKDKPHVPVVGMTVEEARRRKLVRPTKIVNETTIEDTTGVPTHGQHLQEIDYARDLTPSEVRALPKEMTKPLDEDQAELQKTILESTNFNPDDPNVLTRVIQSVTGSRKETVPAPPVLPQPVIEEDASEVRPLDAESAQQRFICPIDGKGFQYRAHLAKHVRAKYPDRFDEIMRRFPKS